MSNSNQREVTEAREYFNANGSARKTLKETSTNSINRSYLGECNLTYAVQLMGGRWKLLILMRLENGKRRFADLNKQIPNITDRMLTLQLREMERDQLIIRKVYAEVPARVEYELTDIGKGLLPICSSLHDWGTRHRMLHHGTTSSLTHVEPA
jgi:DNA-binding HxlR family transcriptional regulator